MSYSLQVQIAIYSALSANTDLTSLVSDIFDDTPQFNGVDDSSIFPYVIIGEDSAISYHSDDLDGFSLTVNVHTFSRFAGYEEIKNIQWEIFKSLHKATLSVTGWNFILCEHEQDQVFKDQDGKTRHGVSTYKILIREVPA